MKDSSTEKRSKKLQASVTPTTKKIIIGYAKAYPREGYTAESEIVGWIVEEWLTNHGALKPGEDPEFLKFLAWSKSVAKEKKVSFTWSPRSVSLRDTAADASNRSPKIRRIP